MALVVHVGAHKTGTSLIQKYFRDRAPDFSNSKVALVPRGDCNQLIGWGSALIDSPLLLRDRLEDELSAEPNSIVVSHENTLGRPFMTGHSGLYPHATAHLEALAEVLRGMDVRIVFYVREIPDFVESYYLQTIHEGAWHSFDEWYEGIDGASLSWNPVVNSLDRVFGAKSSIVVDFGEIKYGQDEFLSRFMIRSGIPLPPKVRYKPRRNASISEVGLEIALRVNPFLENREHRSAMRKFLQEYFSNATGPRARPMPNEVRESLINQTHSEYSALRARSEATLPMQ